MTIVRLDLIMTSMIDSFNEMITGYHDQQSAQNERENQFENGEGEGQPDVAETSHEVINEIPRCLSLTGSRVPMESARLYKQYLPLTCRQHIESIMNISVQQIQINERYFLREDLSINQDSV